MQQPACRTHTAQPAFSTNHSGANVTPTCGAHSRVCLQLWGCCLPCCIIRHQDCDGLVGLVQHILQICKTDHPAAMYIYHTHVVHRFCLLILINSKCMDIMSQTANASGMVSVPACVIMGARHSLNMIPCSNLHISACLANMEQTANICTITQQKVLLSVCICVLL